ncbi:hypothetical protein IDH44_07275 [Paenibacillus sp. IB182496]|uniref:Spore coat protein D n=1 Tax=Paenibacillus sabuli TaxID=2772509 RepID=A0A927BS95_9BACL|nr:hypothetical protein [Paenibacillus sabuli]MBD2844986.1 hypothetical protein [Paenibacillus sabuli]
MSYQSPCNQSPCPQASPITTAPTQVYNNIYHPQAQPIIHPIEVINQHHCVPVPQHYYTCSVKDVMVSTDRRSMRGKRR